MKQCKFCPLLGEADVSGTPERDKTVSTDLHVKPTLHGSQHPDSLGKGMCLV